MRGSCRFGPKFGGNVRNLHWFRSMQCLQKLQVLSSLRERRRNLWCLQKPSSDTTCVPKMKTVCGWRNAELPRWPRLGNSHLVKSPVGVEKLLTTKFAKIKVRQEALQSIFLGRRDISYPPNFGCLGRKASFSTATPDFNNNLELWTERGCTFLNGGRWNHDNN